MRLALLDRRRAAALRKGLICAFVALGLSACGQAKPLDEVDEGVGTLDGFKPGPGLFSGKDGRWILYGKDYVE